MGQRILVVDDDASTIKLVSEILKKESYHVVTARDGIDAMVKVKEDKPDLLIVDVMMPEVNGYDVCHNLKFDHNYKDLPIIILTAREQELDTSIGNLVGIDYMQKPIDAKVLVEKVNGALAK